MDKVFVGDAWQEYCYWQENDKKNSAKNQYFN